jgi:hypothetical protein
LPDGFFSNQKIPIWVNLFWRALDWKMLTYFVAIWNILQTFGIFYDHLVKFVFIWYIFPGFGIMYQEKSGNPGPEAGSLTTEQLEKLNCSKESNIKLTRVEIVKFSNSKFLKPGL